MTPTLALFVAYMLSSLAATMLCEAMQRIPGNQNFEHRYEFATTVQHYYGRNWCVRVRTRLLAGAPFSVTPGFLLSYLAWAFVLVPVGCSPRGAATGRHEVVAAWPNLIGAVATAVKLTPCSVCELSLLSVLSFCYLFTSLPLSISFAVLRRYIVFQVFYNLSMQASNIAVCIGRHPSTPRPPPPPPFGSADVCCIRQC